jgi:hypothetical protein
MIPQEAQKLVVGSQVELVRLGKPVAKGRVTQVTRTWFMVTWYDGTPEIIRRDRASILLERLHVQTEDT